MLVNLDENTFLSITVRNVIFFVLNRLNLTEYYSYNNNGLLDVSQQIVAGVNWNITLQL